MAQRRTMRRFDGNDVTLANNLVAKNHAVEVIGSHRTLAALTRYIKKTNAKTVKMAATVQNGGRCSSFSRVRSEVKRMVVGRRVLPASALDFLRSYPIDTLFGGRVRGRLLKI
jgi:hypothetical protein